MALRSLALPLLAVILTLGCGASLPQPQVDGVAAPEVPRTGTNGEPAAPRSFAVPDALVPIGPRDPILGNPEAAVTVVVFSDYQCPFCARGQLTLDRVAEAYPTTVRFVIKNLPLPFHEHARDAAVMAQAVFERRGSAAFQRFTRKLYANNEDLDLEHLLIWAKEAGFTRSEADDALKQPSYGAKVLGDAALAEHLGISGTPCFLVNGHRLVGAQPFAEFKRVIDQELQAIAKLPEPRGNVSALYRERTLLNLDEQEAGEKEPSGAPDTSVYRVPIEGSPSDGAASALVTVVLFSDFQCPFCARSEQTMAAIKSRYGKEVRFVFKHSPLAFHPEALPAARFAQRVFAARGNGAFWKVARRLFEKQSELGSKLYALLGKEFGLPPARAGVTAELPQIERAILADQMLAADLKVEGTPQFFINGRRLAGAQPIEAFAALIDARLADAQGMVRAGVKAEDVYGEILKTAKTPDNSALEKVALPPASSPRPARGPLNAAVVVELFSDFQCPFCTRIRGTLAEIEKLHPKQVRIVWRNLPLPFHANAGLAAEAALEAFAQRGASGFWKMEELLFQDQAHLERADLEVAAKKLGLDLKRFGLALDDGRHRASLAEDAAAAESAKIHGTPTAVVNGYVVAGAQPLAVFERIVQEALAEKK